MIINIFYIFDPASSPHYSFNWLRIFLILILIPFQFWLIPSQYNFIWIKIIQYLFNELKSLISYSYINLIIFIRLLLFIFYCNFLRLFPYIFTATRHIRFCLSLSLNMWIRIIIFTIFNYLNNLLSHLTPQGTPLFLIPFIVIIESIRLIIRPFTLAIRLTANIIAGHILLSLLGTIRQKIRFNILFLVIFIQCLFFILEIAVSIIQALVFSILSIIYSE